MNHVPFVSLAQNLPSGLNGWIAGVGVAIATAVGFWMRQSWHRDRQTQIALRESEQRFRNLADSMPQLVWTANPDGSVDYYNQRSQEFCGFIQKPDGSWDWQPVLHPDDQERTLQAWLAALPIGNIYECEHRIKTADGTFRWYLSRGVPVKNAAGQITKWYGTATDIHTQKQYQAEREELLQREQAARAEAEAASRMKDEFLATLSHELRTPMNSMLGWTVMLRTRQFDAATTTRALETIERNTRSLNQLIEDILDISRIIRGKIHLACQPVNLVAALEAAIDIVQASADAKQIQLTQDFQIPWPRATQSVWADPTRLQQIFWNLLSNAVKFTPVMGTVQIRLAVVSGDAVEPGSEVNNWNPLNPYAEIQIQDSGIGIEPEFLPQVFDRFRQADGSITRTHGGLGLGLAIVRQLLELQGGFVRADSAGPGQGATFTVYLPLLTLAPTSSSDPGGSLPASGSPRLKGLKALVVDDEPDVRELLTVVLENYQVQVNAVASAAAALVALQQSRPDVLISDIGMPEEDGYSLIRQVRALGAAAGGTIPAIALTAYASQEDRQRSLAAGFDEHLPKPVNPTQLVQALGQLVAIAL